MASLARPAAPPRNTSRRTPWPGASSSGWSSPCKPHRARAPRRLGCRPQSGSWQRPGGRGSEKAPAGGRRRSRTRSGGPSSSSAARRWSPPGGGASSSQSTAAARRKLEDLMPGEGGGVRCPLHRPAPSGGPASSQGPTARWCIIPFPPRARSILGLGGRIVFHARPDAMLRFVASSRRVSPGRLAEYAPIQWARCLVNTKDIQLTMR